MARIKVAEAAGPVLDWMVAKAGSQEKYISFDFNLTHPLIISGIQSYGPSFIWSQGGPIIDRELIAVHGNPSWTAQYSVAVLAHHGGYRGTFDMSAPRP